MESIVQDLVVGLRALGRRPAWAAVAATMLAIGIGANTAIYSVLDAVVLRPLPFEAPDSLYYLRAVRGGGLRGYSAPEVVALRARSRSFVDVAYWNEEPFNLTGRGDPERLAGARVTSSLLPLLGVEPLLGRNFTDDEEVTGNDAVVLVGEGTWRRRFAGRPEILGATLELNGRPATVVGVVPDVFSFMEPGVELYMPLAFSEHQMSNPGAHSLVALGRLADGVSREAADQEIDALMQRVTAGFSETHRGSHGAAATPLDVVLLDRHRHAMMLLAAAVGFVLLIACANVANLLLARAAERRREISIRTALGAGRFRLVRQLLTESLLLAAMGGAGGLLVALWGVDLVVRLSPPDVPRIHDAAVDGSTFAFVAAASLGAGFLFGLVPALAASRGRVEQALRSTARGDIVASGRDRSRGVLVSAEMAIALVLLVGAGLTLRSFAELGHVDPGFDPDAVVSARVLLPDSRYASGPEQAAFVSRLLEELDSVPGIRDAAVISPLPFGGGAWRLAVEVPGRPESGDDRFVANWRTISPGYFETMGIPLRAGRDLAGADMRAVESEGDRSVVVVNESFARDFFPGEEVIGKLVVVGYDDILCEIVGVVGDVHHQGLDAEAGAEMYTAFTATPMSEISVAVRAAVPLEPLAASIRDAVWRVDALQPVYAIEPMTSLISASLAPQRFLMTLLGAFATAALVLSALGIYAVMSYVVARRTAEMGIRMALGARGSEILLLVMRQGARLLGMGAAFGLAGSWLLSRYLASHLYGISATDLPTYIAVSAVLGGVAVLAMAIPAYRASRADPLAALRAD